MELTRERQKLIRSLGRSAALDVGAGCGESELIVRLFCDLVARRGVPPERVLVVTPSQRSAELLKDRVARDFDRRALERLPIGTVYSLCTRILRENFLRAEVDPWFSTAGRDRRRVLTAQIYDGLPIPAELSDLDADEIRDAVLALHAQTARIRPPEDPAPFLETFERCLGELFAAVDSPGDELGGQLKRMRSELPRLLRSADKLMSGETDWRTFERMKLYRGRFRPLGDEVVNQITASARQALTDFMAACLDRGSAERSRGLLRLAGAFSEEYRIAKSRLGSLDHNDILTKTADLLEDREVARAYQKLFEYILIEDFHNLDPVEQRILEAISNRSVLSFGEEALTAVPGIQPRPRGIALRENFRSRPGILAFVNFLCSPIGAEDNLPWSDLIPAGRFSERPEPDVELALVPGLRDKSPEKRQIDQAHTISQRVLDLGVQPGDVMVLSCSISDAKVYERVLEQYGIPVRVIGGRYSDDLINLLKVIKDPYDDQAMAELLISPFVGLSEPGLVAVCGQATPFDDPLPDDGRLLRSLDSTLLSDSDREKIHVFRDWFEQLIGRPGTAPSDLLDFAVEASGYDRYLLTMVAGRRKYSALQRFRELARGFQGSLSDFIAVAEESEYTDFAGADSVRVMTVHRAQGLQSPVVFLANISRNIHRRTGIVTWDDEVAVQAANPLTGRFEIPLSHREISAQVLSRAVSDEKRLLYNAMTRAQDRLILVGSTDLRGDHRSTYRETYSWAGWIEKALELGPGSAEGELGIPGGRVRFTCRLPKRFTPETKAEPAANLRDGRPVDLPPDFDRSEVETIAARCLSLKSPAPQVSRLTVSQILDYIECPARFRMLHMLGAPDAGGEPPDDPMPDAVSPADLGSAVHNLLAEIDFTADAEAQCRPLLERLDEPLKSQAKPAVENLLRSGWPEELRSAERILKEVPFELTVEGKILAGRMDVLFQTPDGWTVLDYKTGRAESRERYELQVGVYSMVTSRLTGEIPTRGALLLLSSGDEWVQNTSDGLLADSAASRIADVAEGLASGDFSPHPCSACAWCSFSSRCGKEDKTA